MKKIGIITFHESDNYGTVLQAYALQTTIIQLGFDAEIINFNRKTSKKKHSHTLIERIKYFKKNYNLKVILNRNNIKNYSKEKVLVFSDFRKKHFKYSNERVYTFNELESLSSKYEAIVCGSDMIWADNRSDCLEVYFLQFAPRNKRCSYAPSFGAGEISSELTNKYITYLEGFNSLSCREKSGVKLIEQLTGKSAELVLDPTLLLSAELWKNSGKKVYMNEKYILVYMFEGVPKRVKKIIRDVARYYNAKIVQIPMQEKQFNKDNKNVIGPAEYISLFENASFIFTNSYHGLMFSIIFNKSFYVVPRGIDNKWSQFESRLINTLEMINCESRLISSDFNIDYEKLNIDYKNINIKIEEERKKSINYLKSGLIKTENDIRKD